MTLNNSSLHGILQEISDTNVYHFVQPCQQSDVKVIDTLQMFRENQFLEIIILQKSLYFKIITYTYCIFDDDFTLALHT